MGSSSRCVDRLRAIPQFIPQSIPEVTMRRFLSVLAVASLAIGSPGVVIAQSGESSDIPRRADGKPREIGLPNRLNRYEARLGLGNSADPSRGQRVCLQLNLLFHR